MQAATATYNPSIISGFISGLKPEARLTVTMWAEQYRMLDTKSSAEPGPYRIERTPYLKQICDYLSVHSHIQNIIVMKGVQLGFTEVGINWIGYNIDVAPSPMMAVMPTLDTMKRNVKLRIDPMIESTERLQTKVGGKRSKDGGNTMFQKDYPGGALVLTGANSAAGLRSMPVKNLFLDEIDAYPGDVDGEGDPISLAEKRQSTFGSRKKKYKISTPTIKNQSKIEYEFLQTDQRYYYVPCPHCHEKQTLVFSQLRWEKGKYSVDDVYYECSHSNCKGKIYEHHKTQMLEKGEWIATHPELSTPETVGYHINSLYSPDGWMGWFEICKMYDDAQGDESKIKALVNTIFAETYEVESEQPQWEVLYERAQNYGVEENKPLSSVAFITAGADIQQDRIEVEIVGWAKGRISQQIAYRVLMGDTDKPEVWDKLGDILNETFEREDGSILPIRLMCVDTGYRPAMVDDFAKKYGTGRIIPIKGSDSLQIPFSQPRVSRKTKQGKSVGKLKQWNVGVSYLKSQLYGWLRMNVNVETGEVPNGYCYFTRQDTHYFRGITAEALQPVRNTKNQLVYQWVKKYERNEPLDCRIYSMAAAYMLGFDRWNDDKWDKERGFVAEAKKEAATNTTKSKRKGRNRPDSGFWNR